MKRMMIRIGAIASVVGLLLVMSPSRGRQSGGLPKVRAQGGCSLSSVKGSYGVFRTGATSGGPLAAVGIETFDGAGNSSAIQTIRKNGVTTNDLFADPPAVDLYEVDPNCAGRFVHPDGTVFGHFVVVTYLGGQELFGLSLTDANSVYGVWKKMNSEQD